MTSPSIDKDIKQLKFSYTMGRNGNGIISSENWSFLEKLKMHPYYDPAIVLPDVYSRELKV